MRAVHACKIGARPASGAHVIARARAHSASSAGPPACAPARLQRTCVRLPVARSVRVSVAAGAPGSRRSAKTRCRTGPAAPGAPPLG